MIISWVEVGWVLEFSVMVLGVEGGSGVVGDDDEVVVVNDKAQIREFLENCESKIGKEIESRINEVADIGVAKEGMFNCEKCDKEFTSAVAYDPVNFFTTS